MKLFLEYFGLIVFAFVLLVGGLMVLPNATEMPGTSPGLMVGYGLAFVAIGGGFTWYYFATSSLPGSDRSSRQ